MNPTGIKPVEFRVLVSVDEVKGQTSGGIFLPQHALEREQTAHDRGTLIAASVMAFEDWRGDIPQVGNKIIFKKYAGTIIQHRNERITTKYRLCNDKDICAIIQEGENDG